MTYQWDSQRLLRSSAAIEDTHTAERELMMRWVETWRRAGAELAEIQRREIESADTREAVRQIFGTASLFRDLPKRTTSGLVEQQPWFAKLRAKLRQ